jgi:hypothetical protein
MRAYRATNIYLSFFLSFTLSSGTQDSDNSNLYTLNINFGFAIPKQLEFSHHFGSFPCSSYHFPEPRYEKMKNYRSSTNKSGVPVMFLKP